MIVLRRWPAWKGFAILGDENSIRMRFRPFEGSFWSLRPRYGFRPNDFFFWIIEGIRVSASLSALKKNWRKVAFAVGLWTRGDSGNYNVLAVSDLPSAV
jgi:hypothetical protein